MFKADEGSGDIVGVQGSTNPKEPSEGGVAVPSGYRSGDPCPTRPSIWTRPLQL
jgi:hypothetical protein